MYIEYYISNGRKYLIELLVTAAEHESQNEFVITHEIIEQSESKRNEGGFKRQWQSKAYLIKKFERSKKDTANEQIVF